MQNGSVNRLETTWPAVPPNQMDNGPMSTWSNTAKSWENKLEAFVTDHPRLALTAAVAGGLLLGWMVKRK
jgi:hypothetical protein